IMRGSSAVLVYNQTYPLLNSAEAAVVTSGTATLETAIFRVPQVVIYKTSIINYIIGKPFIRITFFSLVNLIAGKEVVKEILQFGLAPSIQKELSKILQNRNYYEGMLKEYKRISLILGGPGTSGRIANRIVSILNNK
ncbi:MAG: lipid-A-disaccharide synthase, partial [Bacteroidales bacterium]|nr:lipid-A-disaccharide synthase [Bacteroidales bacterium]